MIGLDGWMYVISQSLFGDLQKVMEKEKEQQGNKNQDTENKISSKQTTHRNPLRTYFSNH